MCDNKKPNQAEESHNQQGWASGLEPCQGQLGSFGEDMAPPKLLNNNPGHRQGIDLRQAFRMAKTFAGGIAAVRAGAGRADDPVLWSCRKEWSGDALITKNRNRGDLQRHCQMQYARIRANMQAATFQESRQTRNTQLLCEQLQARIL